MFERLATKVLHRFLSKYFTTPTTASSSSSSTSTSSDATNISTGVWSGYISLTNLLLRPHVLNDIFESKGQPWKCNVCFIHTLEITVPWAKLGSSSSSTSNKKTDESKEGDNNKKEEEDDIII
eukprot:5903773-Ditylum_brightwellii.AAC.1